MRSNLEIVENILNCVSDHHRELEKIERQKIKVKKEMKAKSKGLEAILQTELDKVIKAS